MRADQKLLQVRLVRFGVPADMAAKVAETGKLWHRDGRRWESCPLARQGAGLEIAEHAACVLTNWYRCYHVSPTRLAMTALAA